jgi:acyl-CoA thioesterase
MDKRWLPREKGSKKKSHGLKNYQHPDLYGEWLGYTIAKLDRKKFVAKTRLILRDDHLSPAKRVHGGVVAGFFDFSCGAAVFSSLGPEDFCSTVELKVNYFRPLFSGDHLECNAKIVFRGNRLCVVEAFLYRKKEKPPVAMATATFNIVTKK